MFSCGEALRTLEVPYEKLFPLVSDLTLIGEWRRHFEDPEQLPNGEFLVKWRGEEYMMGVQADFKTGLINYYWQSQAEEYHHHEWARLKPAGEDTCEILLAAPAEHDPSGVSGRLEDELDALAELADKPAPEIE